MMTSLRIKSKSDVIGATAGSLCFIHCVATPFLFVAHASTVAIEAIHPWWWGLLDMVFLAISFFAIYWSARTTSKQWMKYALWFAWMLLGLLVINEKVAFWAISEEAIYIPSMALVFLHIYNRKYCKCKDSAC